MRFWLAIGLWGISALMIAAEQDDDSLRDESFGHWPILEKEEGKTVTPVERFAAKYSRGAEINAPGYEKELLRSPIVGKQRLRLIRRFGLCEAKDLYIASLETEEGKVLQQVLHTYPVCKLGVILQWKEGFIYHVKDRALHKQAFYISAKGHRDITEDKDYRSQDFFREILVL